MRLCAGICPVKAAWMALSVLMLGVAISQAAGPPTEMAQPNFIVILADDKY